MKKNAKLNFNEWMLANLNNQRNVRARISCQTEDCSPRLADCVSWARRCDIK